MGEDPDLVLLLLACLIPLWHGAALVEVARSGRGLGAKLGWMLAILVLIPFGLLAWLLRGRERGGPRYWGVAIYLSLAILAVAALLGLTRAHWSGREHLAWLAAWSVVTLVMYALDKLAAKAGKNERGGSKVSRVPEKVLHLLALLGGFFGGWIGRQVLRHKSNKPVFLIVLALATVVHLGLFFALRWL